MLLIVILVLVVVVGRKKDDIITLLMKMMMMMMLSKNEDFSPLEWFEKCEVLFGTFTRAKKARIIKSDERDFNRVTTMRRER